MFLWRYLGLEGFMESTEKFLHLHLFFFEIVRTIPEKILCISGEVTVFIMDLHLLWLMSAQLGWVRRVLSFQEYLKGASSRQLTKLMTAPGSSLRWPHPGRPCLSQCPSRTVLLLTGSSVRWLTVFRTVCLEIEPPDRTCSLLLISPSCLPHKLLELPQTNTLP